jgi:hypothetical protein
MEKSRWLSLIILVAALLLAACQGEVVTIPEGEVYASVEALPQSETNPISAAPTPISQTPAEPNECLNCHADKQRLIDTAKPEEVVESESSGVG